MADERKELLPGAYTVQEGKEGKVFAIWLQLSLSKCAIVAASTAKATAIVTIAEETAKAPAVTTTTTSTATGTSPQELRYSLSEK